MLSKCHRLVNMCHIVKTMSDLSRREKATFVPLVVITLWMGIYPSTFLKPMEVSIEKLISTYQAALLQSRQASIHAVDAPALAKRN